MEKNILKIIPVQGFCPLKIEITQFPGGFRLNMSFPRQMIYRDASSSFDYFNRSFMFLAFIWTSSRL